MYKLYYSLYKEAKIDENDLIEGFESEGSMQEHILRETPFVKESIVECKQRELNMVMKIGWEENKVDCERVVNVLRQYMWIYQKYSVHKSDLVEVGLFVKGLKDKIEKCL